MEAPGLGLCSSRAGAGSHGFTQFHQTFLGKFNFPAPAHWADLLTAPTLKGRGVVLQSHLHMAFPACLWAEVQKRALRELGGAQRCSLGFCVSYPNYEKIVFIPKYR